MKHFYTQSDVAREAKISRSGFHHLILRGAVPEPSHRVAGRRFFYTQTEKDAIVAGLRDRARAKLKKLAEQCGEGPGLVSE